MSQYVVYVACWLLTLGRASVLTDMTSSYIVTTSTTPQSPKPPPSSTSTLRPRSTVSTFNFSTHPSTTPPTTPRISTTLKTPITPSNVSSSIKVFLDKTTKETVPNVEQGVQREWYVRRKHKGPYFKGRVQKLAASLSATEPTLTSKKKFYLRRKSNFSDNVIRNVSFESINSAKSSKGHTDLRFSRILVKSNLTNVHSTTSNTGRKAASVRGQKRPMTIGIPASSTVVLTHRVTTPSAPTPSQESYNPQESDEYYSSYGEYQDLPIIAYNNSGYSEAAVLPDPDTDPDVDPESTGEEPEIVLPDDSLADTDLHDHDLIDSVMYIYFGSSERDERGAGRQVLIVGAVISLVAQSLTLVSVLRRLRSRADEPSSLVLLNAEFALTAANLVFMLGVQATGSKRGCELVAVTLHYLHLVTGCWFLVNSVFCYLPEGSRSLRRWGLAAWCGPAVVVLACVMFNRRGYETRSFCWMSVARGMLYSFMAPVAVLLLLNTLFTVLGLRQLSHSSKPEESDRKSLRISATLLPVFAVVWFLGVVALENSASLVFPLMFVASSGFLNWFVLACWLPADLSLWRETDEEYDDDDEDLYEEVLKSPLLQEPSVYVCGRRDTCDLQMDPICTISS